MSYNTTIKSAAKAIKTKEFMWWYDSCSTDYTDQTMLEILVSCFTIFSGKKTSNCNDNCRISLKIVHLI